MSSKTLAKPKCVGCKKEPRRARGLCRKCWVRASRRVNAGEVTWEDLEASKAALPVGSSKSPYLKKITAIAKNKSK